MKKSKVILFSYIGFLASVFLVFVIYLKATDGERKTQSKDKYSQVVVDLPLYDHIKVLKQSVTIENGDKNMATVSYLKDSVPPEILWRMAGDTLYIESSKKYRDLKLKVQQRSRIEITSLHARIYMNNMKSDTLVLTGISARFDGFRNSESGLLIASLLKSNLNFYNGNIGIAEIDIDDSRFNVRNSIKQTSGTARNGSNIELRKVRKIDLDVDESSRFRCYN